MSNPLMNMIGGMIGNNNPMQMVQQVMGMVRGSKQAMEMCKGKNPQEVFNSLCQQQGMNPQDIVDKVNK